MDIQENRSPEKMEPSGRDSYGVLYLVAVPIGNDLDFSERAKLTLSSVDYVLCEEFKEARRFLKLLGIDKKLIALNEHTEKIETDNIIRELKTGKNIALISDHGTPLLEDPGTFIVKRAITEKIKVTSVPGASSIITALILSGFNTKKFFYYGLLSPVTAERNAELRKIKNIDASVILLDTPYRMSALLNSILETMGKNQEIALMINLTMDDETIIRGKVEKVINDVNALGIKKSEFVLVLKGNEKNKPNRKHKKIIRR